MYIFVFLYVTQEERRSHGQCPEIGLRKSVKNAGTSLFREDVDIINRPPPHITT